MRVCCSHFVRPDGVAVTLGRSHAPTRGRLYITYCYIGRGAPGSYHINVRVAAVILAVIASDRRQVLLHQGEWPEMRGPQSTAGHSFILGSFGLWLPCALRMTHTAAAWEHLLCNTDDVLLYL